MCSTDEGLGSSSCGAGGDTGGAGGVSNSSSRVCGSGSVGSGSVCSVYLSDSQDWAISPSPSPDEGPAHQGGAISPLLAEETFRYMSMSF